MCGTRVFVGVLVSVMIGGAWTGPAVADPAYSLEEDFLTGGNHSNTVSDTWQYYATNPDGSYTPLPYYHTSFFDITGNEGWALYKDDEFSDFPPFVCKNTNGSSLSPFEGASVPPKAVWVCPVAWPDGSAGAVAAAFLVPQTAMYALAGTITDLDGHGGDGVAWYLDRNAGNLDSGSADGNSDSFSLTTQLTQGDLVYLIVAPKGNPFHDSTRLTFHASVIPEPFSMAFLGSAFAGVVAYRFRMRRRDVGK